ncbi:hypothetical protein ACFCYB_00320 [Streptomyces sp. NPDC056309]|uniref:hypothetical protein n=1 Tax=Streptomyces sp. NPDC056309 TaxID=3345781 RepID=UPI0035DC8DB3
MTDQPVGCQPQDCCGDPNAHQQPPTDQAAAALDAVRRLCDLTIATSVRTQAIDQARDTLAVIDRAMASETHPVDRAATDTIRDNLLHAIDSTYAYGVLGYGTPEDLLTAYDASRAAEVEPPLSPYYSHEACGFHWHGRDGMDIPMRDGQPVCPRCELRRLADEEKQSGESR